MKLIDPDHVQPHHASASMDGSVLRAQLEPLSWNVLLLKKER